LTARTDRTGELHLVPEKGKGKDYTEEDVIKTTMYLPIPLNRRLMHYKADTMNTTYGRNEIVNEALDFFLKAKGY
jgi:hypothetical protein